MVLRITAKVVLKELRAPFEVTSIAHYLILPVFHMLRVPLEFQSFYTNLLASLHGAYSTDNKLDELVSITVSFYVAVGYSGGMGSLILSHGFEVVNASGRDEGFFMLCGSLSCR